MMKYHGHIIEPGDDESVRTAKSQINDERMLDFNYWIPPEDDDDEDDDGTDKHADIIDYHYILDSHHSVVGMELIIGV